MKEEHYSRCENCAKKLPKWWLWQCETCSIVRCRRCLLVAHSHAPAVSVWTTLNRARRRTSTESHVRFAHRVR